MQSRKYRVQGVVASISGLCTMSVGQVTGVGDLGKGAGQ